MLSKNELLKELQHRDFSDMFFDDARNDIDIALAAVKKDPTHYNLLGWEAQNHPKIIKVVAKKDASLVASLLENIDNATDDNTKNNLPQNGYLIIEIDKTISKGNRIH